MYRKLYITMYSYNHEPRPPQRLHNLLGSVWHEEKEESVQQSFVSQKSQAVKYVIEKDTIKQTSWMMALFFSSSLDNNRCQKNQSN